MKKKSSRPDEDLNIAPGEVKLGEKVGAGGFGNVYSAECRGRKIAVKIVKKNGKTDELGILKTLRHPNICQYLGSYTLGKKLHLCLEFIEYNLTDVLVRNKWKCSLLDRMRMARDAARGMNYLHTLKTKIIHRDLKTDNLMMDSNGHVKVCDFGLSQELKKDYQHAKDLRGTHRWQAPETMVPGNVKVTAKSDVYSFGLVLWQMVTQKEIFYDHPLDEDKNDFEDFIKSGKRMVIPTDTPLSISSLICKCWASDPDDRPSFAEVLNDIYGIILELAVSDSLAREWWKENFFPRSGLEEEVPWDAFKEKVAATLEASGKGAVCAEYTDKMWSSFRAIVANDTGDRRDPAKVKIDEFGSSVEYLGGFGVGFDVMVSHAWDLTSCRCFTGRQDIADVRENEFYVRFSKTYPGCYTVCFFLPGAVSKKLLLGRDKSNRIVFEEKPVSNIQDVIRGVESFGYRPCTTYSPYKWIFCESKYI